MRFQIFLRLLLWRGLKELQTKRCVKCGETKPLDEFHKDARRLSGKRGRCKQCMFVDRKIDYAKNRERRVASTLNWRQRNREFFRESQRRQRREAKQKIVDAYGGKCTCCGESTFEFLTLEHLNRDGKDHRKAKGGPLGTYRDVIKRGFPKEYTILCCNCNYAERLGKTCPHKLARACKGKDGRPRNEYNQPTTATIYSPRRSR